MDAAEGSRLSLRGIGKTYAVRVLSDIDLDLDAGQVHALVGANGAGKSTLAKIICGLTTPTTGEMTLGESSYRPRDKADAESGGIHIVQQELNLIETISVAENLFLNRLPSQAGLIDYATLYDRARAALSLMELDDIDPKTPVSQLGVGQKQLVEIAAALSRECRWLILDEPTAALTAPQIDCLFGHVKRLQNAGAGIIYISHRMEEIERICDSAAILRDGRLVATQMITDFSLDSAVRLMLGESAPSDTISRTPIAIPEPTQSAVALSVDGLCRGPLVRDVSFEARSGEILGIAGLVGSGRTELLRAIFGADTPDSGIVRVGNDDAVTPIQSPADAVEAGIAMTPEDRKNDGLLLEKSIELNTTLGLSAELSRKPCWINREAERAAANQAVNETDIQCNSTDQPVEELSGGNQQKALISRWLLHDASVYLFDEPTRGVDVGAKAGIHRLLSQLADRGKAVVVVSSELSELMDISDRIAVMARGKLVSTFDRSNWSQEEILTAAFGGDV